MQQQVLNQDIPAIDVTEGTKNPVVLTAGTRIQVEIGKFEWLGQEGLYSEISVPERPGHRFRVRYHRLHQASRG